MTPPLLAFDNVSFAWPGASPTSPILDRVTFALPEGSATALIGPNGAGKTTLLRLAAGTLAPTSGEILLDGIPLARQTQRHRARIVAHVPQRLEVPFQFTVQQIVEQGRTPYARPLRGLVVQDRVAIERALALTATTALRHRIFNELSGGERQRVKIALGLAQQPRLLLLDEPTQSLDIGRQIELLDLLHQLRAEGITLFAAIHDLHHVRGHFDRVLLLGPDRQIQAGAPEEVMTPARLEWAFDCPPGRYPQHAPHLTGATP